MPSFTITQPDLQSTGPILEIRAAISKSLYDNLQKNGEVIPPPVKVVAMIDTGASSSVLNPDIISKLSLNPIGQIKINTPSCVGLDCYQYSVAFVLPNGVIIEVSDVIEAPLQGQNIQCLIGRDILKLGVLIYNGYMQSVTFSV